MLKPITNEPEDLLPDSKKQEIIGKPVVPGDIRINNIYMNIPPESISLIKTEYDVSTFMLREAIPSTEKKGRKKVILHVPLIFDLGTTGNNYSEIANLLIQIRKCPIVTIENEKVRKELYGPDSDETISMSFVVDAVHGSIDGDFPTLLRCDLQMTWFNHLPYTPSVLYKGIKGEVPRSKHPGALFEEYVHHNTLIDNVLINDPSNTGLFHSDTLEIFYKEYARYPKSITTTDNPAGESAMHVKKKTRNLNVNAELEKQGWVNASDRFDFEEKDDVYYRWKRFPIHTSELEESGALVLESLGFSLATNVAYIPLQGHTCPTAQFMGGSISHLRGVVYASAEKDAENTPIGTSDKLAELQKIFDKTSDNRLKYPKYAQQDCLLIRHPIAKLMKYKPYTESRSIKVGGKNRTSSDNRYFENNETYSFDYNDMLPVVVSNRSSVTVTGQPFGSRFQFDAKETRLKSTNDTITIAGEGTGAEKGTSFARNTLRKSWVEMATGIEKKYKITKKAFANNNRFVLGTSEVGPDREEALQLAEAMTNMLSINGSFNNLTEIMDSNLFSMSHREIGSLPLISTGKKNWHRANTTEYANQVKISEIVASVIKKAAAEGYEGWGSVYRDSAYILSALHTIPYSETYPDLMIPNHRTTPTYYFNDFEDEVLHRNIAMKAMLSDMPRMDQVISSQFQSKDAHNNISKDTVPSVGGVSNAVSKSSGDKKSGIAHTPDTPEHRYFLAVQAMGLATSMNNSLRHAFPTFKIYLKQEDHFFPKELSVADRSKAEQANLLQSFKDFSEFFDISDIVDIRLVKDQENPADLLVIRIVASERDKVNRIKSNINNQTQEERYDPERIKDKLGEAKQEGKGITRVEERFKKAGLTEGTRIQARLGYASNPNDLTPEFNGRIVSIRGKDIIEVIALGNGEELVKEAKAATIADTYSFNSNTPDLIAEVFEDCPEIVSFGNTNYKSDMGFEFGFMPEFAGGRSALDNVFAPSLFNSYGAVKMIEGLVENASLLASIGHVALPAIVWTGAKFGIAVLAGATLGKVIAVGAAAAAVWEGFKVTKRWLYGSQFTIYNNTVWEILQECTLRHPGTICSAVPYDNRSTIFFGEPNEHYFYRGPTPLEAGVLPSDSFFNKSLQERFSEKLDIDSFGDSTTVVGAFSKENALKSKKKQLVTDVKKNQKPSEESILFNMIKPFRTYHLVSSEHDIIANTIEVTSRDVANSIQIAYPSDCDDGNFDGSVGFSDYKLSNEIKADDDLYPEFIKKKVLPFHNAHTSTVDDMPERYAKSVLCRELEKVYQGKLVITGRPGIKPHDVVIMRDIANDIMGPVGVSKVIHIMNPQQGWVTEVVPKLLVFPDNASGAFQLKAVVLGATYWLSDEAERYYTNIKRYMPNDSGTTTLGSELIELGRLIGGSNIEEYEDLYISKDEVGNINTGNFTDDLTKSNSLYSAASIAGSSAGYVTGEVAQAAINNFGVTEKLVKATRTGATVTAIGAGSVLSETAGLIGGQAVSKSGIAVDVLKTGLSGVGTVAKGGLTVASKLAGPLAHLALSGVVNNIISWTKYRQPIMFFPLTREGEPWYAAMNGFRDNTLAESIMLEKYIFQSKYAVAKEYLNVIVERAMRE